MAARGKKRGVRDGIRTRDGKWYVNYTVRGEGRVEVLVPAASYQEAKEERAKLVKTARAKLLGLWEGDPDLTLAGLLERYERVASGQASWRGKRGFIVKHLIPTLGKRRLNSIVPSDVEELLAKKEREGLSAQSCHHLRAYGRTLFNFAIKSNRSHRGENPFALARPPRVQKREPHTLDVGIIHDVIEAVEPRWKNFFAMALYTGLRCGELRGLRPEDIDAHRRWLVVRRSGAMATTKTAKGRRMPIPPELLPYLDAALEATKGRPYVFVDTKGRQLSRNIKVPEILRWALAKLGLVSSYTLWCRKPGCHHRERDLAQPVQKDCLRCGRALVVLPEAPIVFHDLRKTWESYLLEKTGNAYAVAQLAGHDPAVMVGHYLRRTPSATLEAMAAQVVFKELSTNRPLKSLGEGESTEGSNGT
jgi:integrase